MLNSMTYLGYSLRASPATVPGSRKNPPRPKAPAAERKALHTLGLDSEADWPAIKARYKRLAKRFHPDANGGDRQAEERLKEINLAYSALKGRAKV